MKKKQKYETKDLYIGRLGYVRKRANSPIEIERRDIIIIYERVKIDNLDYCAKEIFTNQTYYFFHGNLCDHDTICRAINNFAIFSSTPLSTIFSKEKITKKELIEIYNNYKEKVVDYKKEEKDKTIPITDSILQMILETSKKVKVAKIDECLKEQTLKELEYLSEYYVNKIINKIENNENNNLEITLENEYTIKMETMRRLVEIEQIYINNEQSKKYSLQRQLVQLKNDLK